MELINATRMTTGYTMGLEPSGRELLVVVIKGTFVLPKNGESVRLADEQLPLVMADTFSGEPGFSAPLREIDYAPRKPMCDVLLTGCARAPAGMKVTRLRCGLSVGPMEKTFDVVGERVWQAGLSSISASEPQYFTAMPVGYDHAFGGADRNSDDASEHDAYLPNPVGRGWHKHLRRSWVDGTPLPNTEALGEPVTSPQGKYRPMALGPLGRGWPQRARYAGTYDQDWLDNVFPFLPQDFDERYYQAAPADQQLVLPTGPMQVVLSGFMADGERRFTLPYFEAPLHVFRKKCGRREDYTAKLDTIVFEPDQERFTMTWRHARILAMSMHEVAQVLVGRKGKEWWQQREQVAFPIPILAAPAEESKPEVEAPG